MSDPHCFDRHLGNANGNPDQQKRELGNTLLADAKATGREWRQELDRFFPTVSDLDGLPDGSWLLTMSFTLAQPFTSKTESAFHPYEKRRVRGNTEWFEVQNPLASMASSASRYQRGNTEWFEVQNPLVRDHLTGLPLVKPTTWKGHLRFAARMASIPKTMIHRLFGETLGDEDGGAGRLHFFPTFFTADVQREVVTPLKRSTRTPARGPIDIEVIPRGSTGTFCLLYLPHPKGPGWSLAQIADDLDAVAPALKAMFLDYGFSAKKTAGWGITEDTVSDGCLCARGAMWSATDGGAVEARSQPFTSPEEVFLPLLDEAGLPLASVQTPDGAWLSNREFNLLGEKPTSLNVYQRFRRWYGAHGPEWRRRLARGEPTSAIPVQTYPVQSVTALRDLASRLAQAIRTESANG